MNILLTGAAGFIGMHVAEQLLLHLNCLLLIHFRYLVCIHYLHLILFFL